MPRVYTKTKSSRPTKRPYMCTCGKPILPGQKYYEWGFRFGGTYRRHIEEGGPKPSELTQSKMASVLSAIEDAEETLVNAGSFDEIAEALEGVAEAAREVAGEYREAVQAMNMEGSGTENEERADNLDSFADELDDSASTVRDKESEVDAKAEEIRKDEAQLKADLNRTEEPEEAEADEEDPEPDEDQRNLAESALLEEARNEASDALGNCPG